MDEPYELGLGYSLSSLARPTNLEMKYCRSVVDDLEGRVPLEGIVLEQVGSGGQVGWTSLIFFHHSRAALAWFLWALSPLVWSSRSPSAIVEELLLYCVTAQSSPIGICIGVIVQKGSSNDDFHLPYFYGSFQLLNAVVMSWNTWGATFLEPLQKQDRLGKGACLMTVDGGNPHILGIIPFPYRHLKPTYDFIDPVNVEFFLHFHGTYRCISTWLWLFLQTSLLEDRSFSPLDGLQLAVQLPSTLCS